jgi:DNA-binding NarL/FixJ family response regulator
MWRTLLLKDGRLIWRPRVLTVLASYPGESDLLYISELEKESVGRKRVLLADDHSSVLEQIRELLCQDYEIVGAVPDGKALLRTAQEVQPDLIISDISMPEMSGFEAAEKIRALGNQVKFIFLTMQSGAAYIKKARSLGAAGYVLKAQTNEELPQAVAKVIAGETYFSPDLKIDGRE